MFRRRYFGGILYLEDFQDAFYVYRSCKRYSMLRKPVGDYLCSKDMLEVLYVFKTCMSTFMF